MKKREVSGPLSWDDLVTHAKPWRKVQMLYHISGNYSVTWKTCDCLSIFSCRPYYPPREFTRVFVAAVYISPDGNSKDARQELYEVISCHMRKQPDGIVIVADDLNQTDLRAVLPKFHQHVHIPTRESNTLGQVHTNIPGSYKALPRSHFGVSDHITHQQMCWWSQRR